MLARVVARAAHAAAPIAARAAASSVVNTLAPKFPLAKLPAPTTVLPGPMKRDAEALLRKHSGTNPLTAAETQRMIHETTLISWGASNVETLQVVRGEGVYLIDADGKRYIDFNSGAMCATMGHTVPQEVLDGINKQLKEIAYAYPCAQSVPIKARLGALLQDIVPGMKRFFFVSGGAEANETALRMAKMFTKRSKIVTRYRSYHGGSVGTMALTGDPRRWPTEPAMGNVVRVMDPDPYHFSFGRSAAEIVANNLTHVEEVLKMEGPQNIAAFFLETVTGTNGVLAPPPGYLEGIRSLCDKYGILMVCDEVMAGFGRTGKWFAYEHSPAHITPDIVTMAKGINGAVLPLGAVGASARVSEFFMTNPINIGTTYNSHPVALASAFEGIKWMLRNRVVENAAAMGPVVIRHMEALAAKHPCVRAARSLGLFGMIDLQKNSAGEPFIDYAGADHPAIAQFKRDLRKHGLFTLHRWSSFFVNPPLIINEAQIAEGFAAIDKALAVVDQAYGK